MLFEMFSHVTKKLMMAGSERGKTSRKHLYPYPDDSSEVREHVGCETWNVDVVHNRRFIKKVFCFTKGAEYLGLAPFWTASFIMFLRSGVKTGVSGGKRRAAGTRGFFRIKPHLFYS